MDNIYGNNYLLSQKTKLWYKKNVKSSSLKTYIRAIPEMYRWGREALFCDLHHPNYLFRRAHYISMMTTIADSSILF